MFRVIAAGGYTMRMFLKKIIKSTMIMVTFIIISICVMSQSKAANDDLVIESGYVEGYVGNGGVVVIPEGVSHINSNVFQNNNNITAIIMPKTIKELPMNAFSNCTALKSVVLPTDITKLPGGLFGGCTSLENITIPESVTSMGTGIFHGCNSLKSVHISSAITEIPYNCFKDCTSLETIALPDKIVTIDTSAFENCISLKQVTIPSGVTKLCERAFYGCTALSEVIVPSNVMFVPGNCFPETVKVKHNVDTGKISDITLGSFEDKIKEGREFEISASFTISGMDYEYCCSDKLYRDMFVWSSSDESIIRTGMGETPGKFLAMKPGKTTLTLTIGGVVKQVVVTVIDDERVFYVVPELRYSEKVELAETNGLRPASKQDIYRYVYENLSRGNYKFAIYETDSLDVENAMNEALAMYEFYLIAYNKPDHLTTEWKSDAKTGKLLSEGDKAYHYDWGNTYYIKDNAGKKVVVWSMYNPDSVKMVNKLNKKADSVIKKIIKKKMNQKQKLKAIHDYLVKNCSYDMMANEKVKIRKKTYYNKNKLDEYSHSAYGAIILKKAVCDGYAHAFSLLCFKAGVSSVFVGGKGHAWNLVKINNKFRYIDVTYDDPVNMDRLNPKKPFAPAKNTKPSYRYFLISSKQLKKNHYFHTKDSYDGDTHTEKWYQTLYNSYASLL